MMKKSREKGDKFFSSTPPTWSGKKIIVETSLVGKPPVVRVGDRRWWGGRNSGSVTRENAVGEADQCEYSLCVRAKV